MKLYVTKDGIRYEINPSSFFRESDTVDGEVDLQAFREKLPGYNFEDLAEIEGSGVTMVSNQSDVAPSLKQRFSDWIDQRTLLGTVKYGQPLQTDNGRNAEQDAFEELLDFCQYQEQSRLELKAEVVRLREEIAERDLVL